MKKIKGKIKEGHNRFFIISYFFVGRYKPRVKGVSIVNTRPDHVSNIVYSTKDSFPSYKFLQKEIAEILLQEENEFSHYTIEKYFNIDERIGIINIQEVDRKAITEFLQ